MTEAPAVSLPFRRDPTCPLNPSTELSELRANKPVCQFLLPSGDPAWLITRHADVRMVLGDNRFATAVNPTTLLRPPSPECEIEEPPTPPGMFAAMNPPEHTRLRRMVAGEFSIKRMDRLRPRVELIVNEHLDAMAEAGGASADLLEVFARPITSMVVCELLGIPREDHLDIQRRSQAAVDSEIDMEEGMAIFLESQEYMAGLIAAQRESPGPDLLGTLVREHAEELTDDELIGVGNLLISAGHEATANMMAMAVVLLLQNPDQAEVIRDRPDLTDQAVEELLRYVSVSFTTLIRTATEDVTISGTQIKAGDYVFVHLPSANRDEVRYDDPDRFDVGRNPEQHLAFGHGVHHCIGASLARMQLRIAIPGLLRRFPSLRLAIPFEELPFRAMGNVHGIDRVPVAW
jgi:cytochrome P450